jgi:hypothetical protein
MEAGARFAVGGPGWHRRERVSDLELRLEWLGGHWARAATRRHYQE